MFSLPRKLISEVIFLIPILTVGLLLIGNYLRYEYLDIGYLDWFMHAFRIKALELNGLTSWTHSWSNGINFWSTYQFASHYFVLGISNLLDISITRAMIVATVVSFILTRVFMYYALRKLGVSRIYAFFGVLLTFASGQQWITMKDFSIYIPIMFAPLLVLLWVKAFNNLRLVYFTAALFGLSWILHPIFGLTFSILFFFLLMVKKNALGLKRIVLSLLLFVVGGFPFFAERFMLHAFSNPYLATPQFLRQLISTPYMGLSLIFTIVLIATNILWITKVSKLSQWLTIFWLYILSMLGFIYLSLQGSFPAIINSLQVPRAITIVALFIPMVFVMTLQVQFSKLNKITLGVLAAVCAIIVTQSISIASIYTAVPINSRINAVSTYFKETAPTGRVYYDGLTEANYLANPRINYVNSYAEHMEPHPLSMRFKQLAELPSVMRQVPESHLQLIRDYSQVLGVEYLFLPKSSPLIAAITSSEEPPFVVVEEKLEDSNGLYTVLKANFPIINAFAYDPSQANISFGSLAEPHVDTRSYAEWDAEVSKMAQLMRNSTSTHANVVYSSPETLEVNLGNINNNNSHIIVNTSYSPNWQAENAEIRKTALNFMDLKPNANSNVIKMKHSWPEWKMPAHTASLSAVAIGGLLYTVAKKK